MSLVCGYQKFDNATCHLHTWFFQLILKMKLTVIAIAALKKIKGLKSVIYGKKHNYFCNCRFGR